MIRDLLFIIFVIQACCLAAQPELPADLSFYGDVMVHASQPDNRKRASVEFHKLFGQYLQTAESKSNPLTSLPWITVIAPADSTFRIITWQVEEDVQKYSYYGFIQHLKKELSPLELKDTRPLNAELGTFDQETWYGAIYYGIQSFQTQSGAEAYMVVGFNAGDHQVNHRVADILILDEMMVNLGMPVFVNDSLQETQDRIILTYSDAGSATMRFDREKEMLIYDHIIPINSPTGPLMVADGSYHGYKNDKGIWYFIDSVFNVIMEEPPGGRLPETTKRDLFGREIKKN
jgi:hypothetical protein